MTNPAESYSRSEATGYTDYEALLAASKVDQTDSTESLSFQAYMTRANEMDRSTRYYQSRGQTGNEIRRNLEEVYVEDESDPRFKSFGIVIADLPMMASYQRWLDENPASISTPQGRELVYRRCEFNGIMRDVILDARDTVNRPQFAEAIETAMRGRATQFAHKVINGATSEILLLDAAVEVAGDDHAEFTTTAEDFAGIDIISQYKGTVIGLDSKTQDRRPALGRKFHDGSMIPVITMGVNTDVAHDTKFSMSVGGRKVLTTRLRDSFEIARELGR